MLQMLLSCVTIPPEYVREDIDIRNASPSKITYIYAYIQPVTNVNLNLHYINL